mgnify:CR=1 FL=1
MTKDRFTIWIHKQPVSDDSDDGSEKKSKILSKVKSDDTNKMFVEGDNWKSTNDTEKIINNHKPKT